MNDVCVRLARRATAELPLSACLVASALCLHCADDDAPKPLTAVQLDFAVEVNGASFSCGEEYSEVGEPPATFVSTDVRFYLHDIELVDDNGTAHSLSLDEGAFQNQNLALLDFEDGCGSDGTPEMNRVVTGSVVSGNYRGIRFTLGVPEERNFINLVTAKAPLDVTGMFWTWQSGYKFLKVDGYSPNADGALNPFFMHVGSSGCPGENPLAPPSADCSFPNQVTYELSFTPGQQEIVADLGGLLATSDITSNTPGTAPGCMSENEDPECETILPRIGVDNADGQVLFKVK